MSDITLKRFSYREHDGQPLQWSIEGVELGQINLLVGKNATGKSRAINIIDNMAKILSSRTVVISETGFDGEFLVDGKTTRYLLKVVEEKVVEEGVWIDGVRKLTRDASTLSLFYEKENKHITHEPAPSEVSAVARRDRHQHPFLIPLYEWAQAVRRYSFGTQLGKEKFALRVKVPNAQHELDDRDQNLLVAIFLKGKKDYPTTFVVELLNDMRALGYPLTEIDATVPQHISIKVSANNIPIPSGEVHMIGVREEGIEGMFFQDAMSQGMFRALSVLAQVNYSQLSSRANCILIDDIGEGLDFDRSALLIELLRTKAKQSRFQLIMATNDQFVMNKVPLDEWSVLQRQGNHVVVRNIHNSRKVFEDFKFVGLSNFAFFEMDFANDNSEASKQLSLEGVPDHE